MITIKNLLSMNVTHQLQSNTSKNWVSYIPRLERPILMVVNLSDRTVRRPGSFSTDHQCRFGVFCRKIEEKVVKKTFVLYFFENLKIYVTLTWYDSSKFIIIGKWVLSKQINFRNGQSCYIFHAIFQNSEFTNLANFSVTPYTVLASKTPVKVL